MSKSKQLPRRHADKDLSELIRIFDNIPLEEFMSLLSLFNSYRKKTSTLRLVLLFADALAVSRIRHLEKSADALVDSERNENHRRRDNVFIVRT